MLTTNTAALIRNSAAYRRELSGERAHMPSKRFLDEQATLRLQGGRIASTSKVCGTCHMLTPATGECESC